MKVGDKILVHFNIILHNIRVGLMTFKLCKRLYNIQFSKKLNIVVGAFLHDIGKHKIDKKILNKPTRLTDNEYAKIKEHTNINYLIIKNQTINNIIKYHHENAEGTGYYMLEADNIPFEAKIVRITDVYTALREKRTYKAKLSSNMAIKIMQQEINNYDVDLFYNFKGLIENNDKKQSQNILKKHINIKE